MAKYRLFLVETAFYSYDIEANSEEDARESFLEQWENETITTNEMTLDYANGGMEIDEVEAINEV